MTNESITVISGGKPYTVKSGAPNFYNLKKALKEKNWKDVPKFLTVAKNVEAWSSAKFKVSGNNVTYEGKAIDHGIAKRIVQMSHDGENPNAMYRFYERLQKNPSKRSVDQLWPFLQKLGIPITPDGCFLAYKGVRRDFYDKHSGTILNKPGVTVEIPRNSVSDDPKEACHFGLHVGAQGYAGTFADTTVICKVDPEHVVCVPYDHGQEKMRVCKYEVLGIHGEELPSTTYDDSEATDAVENGGVEPDDEENLMDVGEEDDGPKVKVHKAGTPAPRKPKKDKDGKPVAHVTKKSTTGSGDYLKYKKMKLADLLTCSLDELRKYATYGLQIVGASKIAGGKTALVQKILAVRK
jgi:hypothetical protein